MHTFRVSAAHVCRIFYRMWAVCTLSWLNTKSILLWNRRRIDVCSVPSQLLCECAKAYEWCVRCILDLFSCAPVCVDMCARFFQSRLPNWNDDDRSKMCLLYHFGQQKWQSRCRAAQKKKSEPKHTNTEYSFEFRNAMQRCIRFSAKLLQLHSVQLDSAIFAAPDQNV